MAPYSYPRSFWFIEIILLFKYGHKKDVSQDRIYPQLAEASLPVVVVNPRQVHNFAKALGLQAKTDTIDASVIARVTDAFSANWMILMIISTRW